MDIMDDFKEIKTLTYHCIKEGCSNYCSSKNRIHMICKLHGEERPVMRYDGKKEKDLIDLGDIGETYLDSEQSKEILSLISKCFYKKLRGNDYYKEVSKFWKDNGYEEFAEECLQKIK